MKYEEIDKVLFVRNRSKLAKQMVSGSLAIFNSNDTMPTSADGVMPFVQNADMFYMTGIDQEESVLMLFPDFHDSKFHEVLFIKETSEHIAIWEGYKYTKEHAAKVSGIKTILWLSQLESVLSTLMAEAKSVYLNSNEHIRSVIEVETRDARFSTWCKQKYPLYRYERLAPIMHELRAVKSPEEVDQIRKACVITNKGFRRVLEFVKPGVMEYEIEAEYAHEFIRSRSSRFAYQPIIASGESACILHYLDNNKACRSGDVILMDVGAEYANYNADMTRCIPVNGKFSARQTDVYNAVLRVKREAEKALPFCVIPEYHKEMGLIMQSELVGLGLIDQTDIKNQDPANPAYRKYFMHGVSHHLGLNVHDVGNVYTPVKPGMVFTIEPGIYIREEGLGIRIEDNYVIEEDGLLNLMREIPIEVEEIEALMNQ